MAVHREPWDSDRGPLERHRRTQPRDLDQVKYNLSDSDCDQENVKCKQNKSILNIKDIKFYLKLSATGLVIYSTMVGTVKLVGCEVRKKKEGEGE